MCDFMKLREMAYDVFFLFKFEQEKNRISRASSIGSSIGSGLATSTESIVEEWERFENMEKKQEIQYWKSQNVDMKKENDRFKVC